MAGGVKNGTQNSQKDLRDTKFAVRVSCDKLPETFGAKAPTSGFIFRLLCWIVTVKEYQKERNACLVNPNTRMQSR